MQIIGSDGPVGTMEREPDVSISLKEGVLNRALAASFYANQGNGLTDLLAKALQLDGSDRGMRLLDPPMVVLLGDDVAMATFGAEAWAMLLGVRLEADVSGSARIRAWMENGEAFLEVQDIELDMIGMGGRVRAPRIAVSAMERALRGALSIPRGGLVRKMPLPTITIPPMYPNAKEREMHITSMAVHEGALALGASASAGDAYAPLPAAFQRDVVVRLTEPFLEQMLGEAWDNVPQVAEVERRIDVPDARSLIDVVKGSVDVILARGLRKDRIRTDRSWLDANAIIQYGCPGLRLLGGNRIEVSGCPLHISAHLRPRMEAATPLGAWGRIKATLMPWRHDDREEREVLDLADLSEEQDLRIVKATARLSIDDGALAVKIEDLDIDVDLDWGLPSDVLEKVSGWIIEQAAEMFPAVKMRLPLETFMIPVLGVAPSIQLDSLDGGEGYLEVHAGLTFTEVPPPISPLPRFTADKQLKLVHRDDCPSTHLVPETAKVGYFSLYDAISDGYRGCPECLSIYRNAAVPEGDGTGAVVRQVLKR